MLFNSAIYCLYLVTSFFLFWISLLFIFRPLVASLFSGENGSKKTGTRYLQATTVCILLIISVLFYGYWSYTYLLIIVWLAFVDWVLSLWIASDKSQKISLKLIKKKQLSDLDTRKIGLGISLCHSLSILLFFKYRHYIANLMGINMLKNEQSGGFLSDLVLPLGISFYTFQSISYMVDVSRGLVRPAKNPFLYLTYLLFFPQLVAGPIVRARDFLPQLRKIPRFGRIPWAFASSLLLVGAFKKIVLADHLAVVSDYCFSGSQSLDVLSHWIGLFAYSFQIYCDFSGYTDIAQGSALLLGFRLPENFRLPYLATSFSDFWSRWHISLSQFLKQYLYIPLGGNRLGNLVTYRNLLLVMALGGLWHGASTNFLVWGLGHGFLLVVERFLSYQSFFLSSLNGKCLFRFFRWGLTFFSVVLLWVFFRSSSWESSLWYLQGLFYEIGPFSLPYSLFRTFSLCLFFVVLGHLLGVRYCNSLEVWATNLKRWLDTPLKNVGFAFILAVFSISIVLFGADSKPFVYFVF